METNHVMLLRPHHLYCERYAPWHTPERGQAYLDLEKSIQTALRSQPETRIKVILGPDMLCRLCSNYVDGACRSPRGGEEKVRRLDGIFLTELGIDYGATVTSGQIQTIVASKTPLRYCREKCRSRATCSAMVKR